MEEVKNASVSINLKEGDIVISGSEEFIEKNMEIVFSFVERVKKLSDVSENNTSLSRCEGINTSVEPSDTTKEEIKEETKNNPDKYVEAGVYHIDAADGSISILKKIPGNSKAEKMKNIALIVLYIRKGKILGKDIIPICEKHNCYDGSHFAFTFNSEKTNMVKKGTGKDWTLELTQPGEEAVLALLEEMADDKK